MAERAGDRALHHADRRMGRKFEPKNRPAGRRFTPQGASVTLGQLTCDGEAMTIEGVTAGGAAKQPFPDMRRQSGAVVGDGDGRDFAGARNRNTDQAETACGAGNRDGVVNEVEKNPKQFFWIAEYKARAGIWQINREPVRSKGRRQIDDLPQRSRHIERLAAAAITVAPVAHLAYLRQQNMGRVDGVGAMRA